MKRSFFNIKTFFFLLLGLAFISGCVGKLDIEPTEAVSGELVLSSDENVKALLIGAYDALSNEYLFGGKTLRNSELLGGDADLLWTGSSEEAEEIFKKNMNPANQDIQELWLRGYETINICNNILTTEALSVVLEDDVERIEGEALFIRALVYFELIRFFALPYDAATSNDQMGIPMVTTPTRSITETDNHSRNTVMEIYSQILADLNRAAEILPSSNGFFVTSGAAKALTARVYLQMGEFESARDAADQIIFSNVYSLVNVYENAFNQNGNTSEDIFAIQVSSQDGTNEMNAFFATPEFGGMNGDIEVLQKHLALYGGDDSRRALFYFADDAIRTGKWNNEFGNIGLIRLAEIYLIRAECNFRLGTTVGDTPANDISAIRKRAELPEITSVTLEQILLERKQELAFEGHLIHDIRRLKNSVDIYDYDSPELVFPIPQREIQANPNLDQNPGY